MVLLDGIPVNTVGFVGYFVEDVILSFVIVGDKSPELFCTVITSIIRVARRENMPVNQDVNSELARPVNHFLDFTSPVAGVSVIALLVDVHSDSYDAGLPNFNHSPEGLVGVALREPGHMT